MRTRLFASLAILAVAVGSALPEPDAVGAAQASIGPLPYRPGIDWVRGVDLRPSGPGGYAIDGRGGITAFGGAPPLAGVGTFPADQVEGIALSAPGAGLILDDWGGLHPFGGATKPSTGPYWPGQDVARDVAVLPNGANPPQGVVLDWWGGLHPFGGLALDRSGAPYSPGRDIFRSVTLLPDGSGGWVMDAAGGLFPFGAARLTTIAGGPAWFRQDVARAPPLTPGGDAIAVVDWWGGVHTARVNRAPIPAGTVRSNVVVSGLASPWGMDFGPDGSLFFTEKAGRISVRRPGGQTGLLATLPDVLNSGETGLMGIAVGPHFAQNRFLYVCTGYAPARDIRVLTYQVDSTFTSATRLPGHVVAGIPVTSGRHGGCQLLFGPDATLYVSTGDAADERNPMSPSTLGGKVLRVDPYTGAAPPGNPFRSDPSPVKQLLWSFGHRNPQGLAFRSLTPQVWSAEHGPGCDDETNIEVAGGNYGWQPGTGYDEFVPMTDLRRFPGAIPATFSSGCPTIAPSDIAFLGATWGGWEGALAVATLKEADIRIHEHTASGALLRTTTLFDGAFGRLRSVELGPDGNLYVSTSMGTNDRIIVLSPT